jgi:tetratricopeptide (TPR) repeat protein
LQKKDDMRDAPWSRELEDMYKGQDVYHEQGDMAAAIDIMERLHDKYPGNAEAAFRLIDLYRQNEAGNRADALLEQTLELQHLNPDLLFEHARTFYLQPRTDRQNETTARKLLERVLAGKPNHEEALYLLGTIHLQQGNPEEAIELLERSVQEHPQNQEAWIRLLIAGLNTGQYQQTLVFAKEALVLFPRQFTLLRLAGTAALQSGHNQQALDYLTGALESRQADAVTDEMRSTAASMLGMVYGRLDAPAKSDSLYRQAISWDRNNTTALNNYAYSLAEREVRLERALEMAQRAVDLGPNNSSFLDTLGWIYYKMDRPAEAAEWVEKALETGSASAAVHEHYGDIQHELGNDTTATEYWKKAANLNPDREQSLERKIDRLRP